MELLHRINNNLKDTLRFRIILLFSGIILIIFREPALFLTPRLWAEEGSVFYQFALHHSLFDIFTTVHVGYLTLFNSIVSAIQAKVFSVEQAPIISTYMGFIIQLIPVYIITFTKYAFWDTALKKIVCVLIVIIFTVPELWLNTTNSHFIFGLVTFLIMMVSTDTLSGMHKHIFRGLLLMGGLTGPASVLFTPLFIVKAFKDKTREKFIQTGILVSCSIIQAFIILYTILYNNSYHRLSVPNYRRTLYHYMIDNFSLNVHILSYLNSFLFASSILVFFIYLLVKNRKNNDYLVSLLSVFVVGTFSTLGSLNMAGSPRYAYIPTCIFILVIASEAFNSKLHKNMFKHVALFVLILCLSVNIFYYKYNMRETYNSNFPIWKDEVAKWRADTAYNPRVHPGNDWKVKL